MGSGAHSELWLAPQQAAAVPSAPTLLQPAELLFIFPCAADRYAVSVLWTLDAESFEVQDVWFGRTLIRCVDLT